MTSWRWIWLSLDGNECAGRAGGGREVEERGPSKLSAFLDYFTCREEFLFYGGGEKGRLIVTK